MADNAEILKSIKRRDGIIYSALTPNLKGFKDAVSNSILAMFVLKKVWVYCCTWLAAQSTLLFLELHGCLHILEVFKLCFSI